MQGDGFIVEPVTSVSATSQVGRGTPRVYAILFRIFDDFFDGLFYMLKAACCFPLSTKKSVSVSTRDTKDLPDLNFNNNIQTKEKTNEKKITFAASQATLSSLATTVISRCSVSDSSSWRSSLRRPIKIHDDFDYLGYRNRNESINSKRGLIKNFFSKHRMLRRKGALKKYVTQKFRKRRKSNSIVMPTSSSETMYSKPKLRNVSKKLFAHQLAREMTLGPEAYPCLHKDGKEMSPTKSVIKPIKSIFEGKLKRTFSFFNDIYATNFSRAK